MLSGVVNSSEHRPLLKRDCSTNDKILCSDTGSREKGRRFKVSCPKMSLKKISLDRDHTVSKAKQLLMLLFIVHGHGLQVCRCETGGSTGPQTHLAWTPWPRDLGVDAPKAPVTLDGLECCLQALTTGLCSSQNPLWYFKLGLELGSRGGVHFGSSGLWCFPVCLIEFQSLRRVYCEDTGEEKGVGISSV